jgi:hypothetical protein
MGMRRSRNWLLILLLVLIASVGVWLVSLSLQSRKQASPETPPKPGPGATAGVGPVVEATQTTPRGLLLLIQNAVEAGNFEELLAYHVPEQQPLVRPVLVSIQQLASSQEKAAQEAKTRLGVEAARRIRGGGAGDLDIDIPGCLAPLQGVKQGNQISWNDVVVTQKGDQATVKVGSADPLTIRKVGQRWYLDVVEQGTEEEVCQELAVLQQTCEDLTRVFNQLQQRVTEGSIRKETFAQEYEQLLFSVLLREATR